MNAEQSNELATGHAVSNTLETITTTSELAALPAMQAALKTKLKLIASLAAIQALPTTGTTEDRDRVVAETNDAALIVAAAVLSYANANQLGDLAAKVRLCRSDFVRTRIGQRAQLARQVHDAALGVLPHLAGFGVTEAILDALLAKVGAADVILGSPRAVIMARRVATEKLGITFHEAWTLITQQIDPLMASQRKANPDAYALYQAARVVIDRPGSPAPEETGGGTPVPPDTSGTPTITQPKAG